MARSLARGAPKRGPMRFSELVSKSVRRRPYRNVATILCFAFVASSVVSAYFLVDGAENSVQAGLSRLGADIMVVPFQYGDLSQSVILMGERSTFTFEGSVLEQVSNVSGVAQAAPQLYVATLSEHPCCSGEFELIGFDPDNDFTITPWLEERLGRPLGEDEIIVGSDISGKVGTVLQFYGHNYTVAGRLEKTGMGLDTAGFIRLEDAYVMAEESADRAGEPLNVTRGKISAVMVRLDPGTDPTMVAYEIAVGVPGTTAVPSTQFSKQVSDQLSSATQVLYATTVAVTAVSLPLVALVSSMVANERRRELGLLRAMGATKRFVFSLVFVEALILAVVGGMIGVTATSLVLFNFQALITNGLQIPFLWPSLTVVLGESAWAILIALAVGAVSSLYPAYKSSALEPYESIRKGET